MVWESWSFQDTAGLWWLLSGLLVVIIYLIRPKPREMKIPSLMFFLAQKRAERLASFFRRFIKDPMMLFHLLLILLLALILSGPKFAITENAAAQQKVIVLDISSSMKAQGRFASAKNIVLKNLGERNTIILAADTPLVALIDGSPAEARSLLAKVSPLDTESALGDAVMTAVNYAGKESFALVVSDFGPGTGTDPALALEALRAASMNLDAVGVAKPDPRNVGIIDLTFSKRKVMVLIKNYNDQEQTVPLTYGEQKFLLDLGAQSVAAIELNLTPGTGYVKLQSDDDFSPDNTAYLIVPEALTPKVLLITNNQSRYLTAALRSIPGVQLEVAQPPIVPERGHDLYVLDRVDYDSLLPGTTEYIEAQVRAGKTLVIGAQPELEGQSAQKMLSKVIPVDIQGMLDSSAIGPGTSSPITANVQFEETRRHLHTTPHEGDTVLAYAGDVPFITLSSLGEGKVLYYGYMEDDTNFQRFPSYPLFWAQFVQEVLAQAPLQERNLRTGSVVSAETIILPSGTQVKGSTRMDQVGIYKAGRTYAANLLSEAESDLRPVISSKPAESFSPRPVPMQRDLALGRYLLIAGLVLLLLDLMLMRHRGDIA
ncbi:hypothetical protein COY28_04630 [Candidatus Woesearchaeota archaeon CG_4_10_14_0_2_um_filter_57_5]|nr:MAG: hypothetical protein AUJ68_06630 [Candidatus Woesearchaeota archaeon CG1_02_57_44]PIN70301.1 MAG: hypothetical protein COV94_01830 [Candidatus Woesearchaeota archaeon CG11_big_fil_rev_8_21_14_0_20_57_5]PIZ52183.1 MAG: hypothetical protein COY28_04630 [Candidatus Woesearchaeota archaeon CG_4_10_14_0_2_um_filter_57_5]